jgi:DNA-binding transcriptional MerR regulator
MNRKINEVAKLSGISVRTLHYYDEIGLLHPSEVTEAGYRLYNGQALERLQQILFFRELSFPLNEITSILNSPVFDKHRALENHKKLLLLRRDRLNDLIALVDSTLKGENNMSFQEFNTSDIENAQKQYAQEVKERWGGTAAYAESARKTKEYGKEDWARIQAEAEEIYRNFALNMNRNPGSPEAQKLVADWQAHISKNYYHCTNEILSGLGELYVADERFTENIDKYGQGLAAFMSRSIAFYCK